MFKRWRKFLAASMDALQARRSLAASEHLLELVKTARPLGPRGVLCIAVIRDEMLRLPDFFRHYRALGIERFAVVDNGSTDGGLEFALGQADTSVYRTEAVYADGGYGALWASWVAMREGTGRWCIVADADEHLVYDGCETHPLPKLAELLTVARRRSLPCMMVDMYGSDAIHDANPARDEPLVSVAPFFDRVGYDLQRRRRRINILGPHETGGPRARGFPFPAERSEPLLSKTPLVLWSPSTVFCNSHKVYPWRFNFGLPSGCLLHFKFLADFPGRVAEAVASGRHWNGSIEYRRYAEALGDTSSMTLMWPGSERYTGSHCLVGCGLMSPIQWK